MATMLAGPVERTIRRRAPLSFERHLPEISFETRCSGKRRCELGKTMVGQGTSGKGVQVAPSRHGDSLVGLARILAYSAIHSR